MYTVGKLARRFRMSRSTLLYYDSIGLLSPSGRTGANYRFYSEEDAERLERIRTYRRAGLSLKEITEILDGGGGELRSLLENRLRALNDEISGLREQQRFITGLLKSREVEKHVGVMNRDTWVALLRASGFSEEDMERWHAEFERHDPEKHQEFMRFLCIPEDEIQRIRQAAITPCNCSG